MATISQLNANRENAQFSTGPRTEAGKANSSRNRITLGLYTRADFVQPHERDLYKEFCETMFAELNPETLLEQSLTAEITGAAWRLRRCDNGEAELADFAEKDPLLEESKTKTIRSIERARAAAHSALHRSINQLRKLQKDRQPTAAEESIPENFELFPDADPVEGLLERYQKYVAETQAEAEAASPIETASQPEPLASNCNTPRNAPCPCNSGRKFKHCCARKGPAWQQNQAA
jgi:hypothetical protein